MGDSAEDFRALSAYLKEKRQNRANVNIADLQKLGIPAREQSLNVYRVDGRQGAVMYYPTSSKWQHRGRVYWGTVVDFRGWLKKNHYLGG
jgi:hypothetical protein